MVVVGVIKTKTASGGAKKLLKEAGAIERMQDSDDNISLGDSTSGDSNINNKKGDAYAASILSDKGTGTSKSGGEDTLDEDEKYKLEVAKAETKAVFRLRLLVCLVLLLAAVAISLIVYFVTSGSEHEEYKSQYESAAKKVEEVFLDILNSKIGAVSSLGTAITAHSIDHYRYWPFVSITSFHQRCASAREQSGAIFLHVNPIVRPEQRLEWENFTKTTAGGSDWITKGLEYQDSIGMFDFAMGTLDDRDSNVQQRRPWPIWHREDAATVYRDDAPDDLHDYFLPTWQYSPILRGGLEVNENILAEDMSSNASHLSIQTSSVVVGSFFTGNPGVPRGNDPLSSKMATLMSIPKKTVVVYQGDPVSEIYVPVFDSYDAEDRRPVAVLVAWIHWLAFFEKVLPDSLRGIHVVLSDSCGGLYTYRIDGPKAKLVGQGDLHDTTYDEMKRTSSFQQVTKNISDGTKTGIPLNKDHCTVSIDIYPSDNFQNDYKTDTPVVMTVSVAFVFLFAILMFAVYDGLVERRQKLVMLKAVQSNKLVASLFPENVRERLMEQQAIADQSKKQGKRDSRSAGSFVAPTRRLKGYLDSGDDYEDGYVDTPIADLFPHCTVMFADIAGFTAWSSTRDPAQVFILLQTVYQAFDRIAKRRNVFKVETIGDCYVAVAGLPSPQANHAIIMARFAGECNQKINQLAAALERRLGPDTGDLSMRFGLHSGPVTAGVLQGDRARFQLFGDSVNTAARMESTGIKKKIQVSESTYKLLVEAGKSHWLMPRTKGIVAKGKGGLKTWFVNPYVGGRAGSVASSVTSDKDSQDLATCNPFHNKKEYLLLKKVTAGSADKTGRLIHWIVEMLQEQMRKLVSLRKQPKSAKGFKATYMPTDDPNKTSLDEVAEKIILPRFDKKVFTEAKDVHAVQIDEKVTLELHDYVSTIAGTYRNNPFHNFEHACHVTMACSKFLKRINAPELENVDQAKVGDIASKLHDYTHGINSDPLTTLAILVSALCHDADHQGISNVQLAKEDPAMAERYKNKSVAEQHSLQVAWETLMQSKFSNLRGFLFTCEAEMLRFRQVLVNVVLATDIFDKELNDLRKNRWNKAFHSEEALSREEHGDLRATIVIEHIIQASDVSHTMQHWHIYRKWNKKLFQELYLAFLSGRMAKNPAEFWYKGEIGFFDNYIIPLAKKLKECNVFGVSSDECLNYAMQNRAEWEERGEDILRSMMEEISMLEARIEEVEEGGVEDILEEEEEDMEDDFSENSKEGLAAIWSSVSNEIDV